MPDNSARDGRVGWAAMKLLHTLLERDPSSPRLTVYNEATGARMDFSAQTLDNWACKIANMLEEELELAPGDTIVIDVPVSWQAAVIALGALAARVNYEFTDDTEVGPEVTFASPERAPEHSGDVVVVNDDPFGRGVTETGGELPAGALDFGPTVRFYGDQYMGDAPALDEVVSIPQEHRLLSTGWVDNATFNDAVLAPLAGGGSAVVVAGLTEAERLDVIADNEKVTSRL